MFRNVVKLNTKSSSVGTGFGILVTRNAWVKMKDVMKFSPNSKGFLYYVTSGGCNGFNFNLELLDDKKHTELYKNTKPTIIKNEDVSLYIDPISEMHLLGSTIDYITEDYSKGQFENKFDFNIDSSLATSCGCGISFSPK